VAQHLYNKDRDDQAQQAKQLAAQISSGAVFDKQLKNLQALSKQDFAVYFSGAKLVLRSAIDSYTDWRSVSISVCSTRETIEAPDLGLNATEFDAKIKAALARLDQEISDAKTASTNLKQQKATEDDPSLAAVFDRIGDLKSLKDFADSLGAEKNSNKKVVEAIDQITGTVKIIKNVYDSYTTKLKDFRSLQAQLASLQVPLQKLALEALQVDEEHWKAIAAIRARRKAEEGDLLFLIKDYERRLRTLGLINKDEDACSRTKGDQSQTTDSLGDVIVDTLQVYVQKAKEDSVPVNLAEEAMAKAMSSADTKALANARNDLNRARNVVTEDRDRTFDVLEALYSAAALAARGSTPTKLADLRLAHEEHAYSIRKSAVIARAYELTVSTGAQRLALYHQGGIKPEAVAQLIYAAATVAVPPAILAK